MYCVLRAQKSIDNKVIKFQQMCGTIQRTRQDTMMRFYKVLAVPLLTYGSENWALNRSGRRRIETAETRFLRRVSGHTLRDHIRNTTIREELHIYDLNDKIADMKVQWLQHIEWIQKD